MNKKETEVILQRIEKWYNHLPNLFITDKQNFSAKFGWSKEPTPFSERLKLDYKSIKKGHEWGKMWESAWFHLTGQCPKDWDGDTVATELDFSGEGLVFDKDGKALQGLTNGSIWDPNFARTRVQVVESCTKGEKIEIWVEAAANSLFGVFTDPDPEEESPKRHGWFDAKVESLMFGKFDRNLWHLYLDVRILRGMIKHLDKNSIQRARAIRALNDCINIFSDEQKNADKARTCLQKELGK